MSFLFKTKAISGTERQYQSDGGSVRFSAEIPPSVKSPTCIIPGALPSQVWDFAFMFVEGHKVPLNLFPASL